MNEDILNLRTIFESKKDIDSEYFRKFNGVTIPTNRFGDVWIKVSSQILQMKLSEIQEIEVFKNKLQLAQVTSLIDVINDKYPYCVLDNNGNFIGYDNNTKVTELLDGFQHDNLDGTYFIKTGIYNQFTQDRKHIIHRNFPTSDIEFDFFMFLILLSGFDIKINETVFLNKPFNEEID